MKALLTFDASLVHQMTRRRFYNRLLPSTSFSLSTKPYLQGSVNVYPKP
jgi:hypothetical protein